MMYDPIMELFKQLDFEKKYNEDVDFEGEALYSRLKQTAHEKKYEPDLYMADVIAKMHRLKADDERKKGDPDAAD